MKKKLVGYYDYTVILTYCGMIFGFLGILASTKGCFGNAMIYLMVAGVCDMFDGAVASTKDRNRSEKRFGIQIDSLSDLISFGVMPAVFIYMLLGQSRVVACAAALYVLCALIRLSFYNVQEEERTEVTSERREFFTGVPVTTIAIVLPAMYMILDYHIFKNSIFFLWLLVLGAIGFISPVEIKKPKVIGKIVLIIIGFIEAVAMLFFFGWGAL